MVLDQKRLKYNEYSSQSLDISGNQYRPDVKKVQNLVSKGASIVLNDIEKHNPHLLSIANDLQKITGGRCQGNLYFSMASHKAFGPHFDLHDVFAVHFEGEKVWNIYEKIEKNPVNHPAFSISSEERVKRAGKIIDQVTLKPGDLLYIPRGQYHDALASKNGAIHVAFGLTYFKPIDMMSVLWEKFILNEFMREDIKINSDRKVLKNTLEEFSKQIGLIINSDETLETLTNNIETWPYEINKYSLKDIVSEGIKYKVSKSVRLEKRDNVLFLINLKNKVEVPNQFSELTEYIFQQEYFTYKTLMNKFKSTPENIIDECLESLKKMKVVI
jgi:ribosomal protein L16 Arg81 hydroxylase